MMTDDDKARYAIPHGKTLLPRDRERINEISDGIWQVVFRHLDDEDMSPCAVACSAEVAEAAASAYRRMAGRFWAIHDPDHVAQLAGIRS